MTFFVIGLAAVVVVILIAAFLSIRLGRGEDPGEADTPDRTRPARSSGGQPHDREQRARRPSRDPGQRSRAEAAGGHGRRGERDPGSPHEDYEYAQQRGQRGGDSPVDYGGGRRPAGARAGRRTAAGSGGDRGRGRGNEAVSHRTGRDYDTGALDDGFPLSDHPSSPYPAVDFPSANLPVADFPSGEFPSGAYPAGEFPSGEYPTGDFHSGEYPAADFPSGDYPSVPVREGRRKAPARAGAQARERPDPDRDRGEPRRKASRSSPGRSRGRQQRGKRDDDDDWPSTEWDKLSDEQYWAELSADKPLATTARPAQSPERPQVAGEPAPPARSAAPRQVPETRPGRADDMRDLPARSERSKPEPATQRLPARGEQRRTAAPDAGTQRAGTREDTATGHSAPRYRAGAAPGTGAAPSPPRTPLDEDPLTSPSFSRRTAPVTDSRSYSSGRTGDRATDSRSYSSGRTGDRATGARHHAGDGRSGSYGSRPDDSARHRGDSRSGDPSGYQAGPAGWYGAQPQPAPSGERPYPGYPEQDPAGYAPAPLPGYPPATGQPGYTDSPGYGTGPADGYPGQVYPAPGGPYPDPAATPGNAGGTAPYGYPDASPVLGSYSLDHRGEPVYRSGDPAGGYPAGYEGEYGANPYPAQPGYEGYPPQG